MLHPVYFVITARLGAAAAALYQKCLKNCYHSGAVSSVRLLTISSRMGGVNCKRFSTTTSANTHEQSNGNIRGEYRSKCNDDKDYIEAVVCTENEIEENEMKQLDLGDAGKILLIKQKGKLSALGTKCSHYGAILSTGALGQGRVRCPWHGACFNIETGDIEDFPGLDSIPCHKVTVEHGQVKVRAKRSDLENSKRLKTMVKRCPEDERNFVIIGGGPSGGVCAETLRQEGFTGRIILISMENSVPYDRIKLSKAMDIEIDKLQFRKPEFYEEYGIETMIGVKVNSVNTEMRQIHCSNGYCIKYDKLYIATGARPAVPKIPEVELKNIFTLRSHEDAVAIHKVLHSETELVCLGSSFISLEAASYSLNKVKKVTLIGRTSAPLQDSFGNEIGQRVLKMFQESGIVMIMESGIKKFIGENGQVTGVELLDGKEIPCNVCILGTGTVMNTDFLEGSGIQRNPNGSINADMHLRTNAPDVFVGGDIANAPVYPLGNNPTTIGHYQLAQYHGRVAAINMVGNMLDIRAVPFFWTVLFGKSFRYSGYGKPAEIRIEGSLEELKFVAIYFDKFGNVIAMASCMRDPIVAQFAELQSQGWRLHKNDLEKDPFAWTKLLKSS